MWVNHHGGRAVIDRVDRTFFAISIRAVRRRPRNGERNPSLCCSNAWFGQKQTGPEVILRAGSDTNCLEMNGTLGNDSVSGCPQPQCKSYDLSSA
jgi:hypothetical protein